MKSLRHGLLAALLLGTLTVSAQENFSVNWARHRTYVLNTTSGGANVTGNVANFPVLVRLGANDSIVFSNSKANGADVRFSKADNVTRLAHQIESWDSAGRSALVWVKADTVYGNATSQIRMHFGNAAAADSSSGTAVFDTANGFRAVWHFNNSLNDATVNANNGTNNGTTDSAGFIGRGRNFGGTINQNATADTLGAQYIKLGNPASINFDGNVTVESWVRWYRSNSDRAIISKTFINGEHVKETYMRTTSVASTGITGTRYEAGTRIAAVAPATTIQFRHSAIAATQVGDSAQWVHVTAVYRDTIWRVYRNGVEGALVSNSPVSQVNSGMQSTNGPWFIGGQIRPAASTTWNRWHYGDLDELRISNVARSPDWVKLSHENQRAAQTLLTAQDSVPPQVPGAPTGVAGTAGNAQVSVAFTAPSSDGGAAITGYTVTASPGGATAGGASSPIVVTGLTNGTAYTFTVTATNSAGVGAASSASAAVTPATVPGAPTAAVGTAGNAQVAVTWTAPASNGGAAITAYTVTASPGGATCGWTTGPLTCNVTSLTNGTAYTFTVTATNSVGIGSASSPSVAVTPAAVPGAPTGANAVAGNAAALVLWTAPVSDGGTAITAYTVTAVEDTSRHCGWTTGGLSCTVTGLTNGTAYTFTVTATNSAGVSLASSASAAVTPRTVPDAPTIGTATPGNAQASVAFTAPAFNGGSVITSYTVTSSPGGFTASGAASPIVVTGLTNGTAYTFTVVATNVAGNGAASSASSAAAPRTVPDAPTIGTATPGNAQVSVAFTASVSDGGSAIIGYNATSSPGGFSASGVSSPLVVTGLTNGTAYTFTIVAVNAAGNSAASSASSAVTPRTVAGAPTSPLAVAGNAQATVSWTAPASNGGATITAYTVTASPGGATCGWIQGPFSCTVTGLTNGTAYTFTVVAVNAAGNSAASTASAAVTPTGIHAGHQVIRVTNMERPYSFVIPEAAVAGTEQMTLSISDIWGRTVWAKSIKPDAKTRELTWNGRTTNGRQASAGMYVVRLDATVEGKKVQSAGKSATLKP